MAALWCSDLVVLKSRFCTVKRLLTAVKRYSNVAISTEESGVVQYPPIKPRYPPGQWGNLNESSAWRMSEKTADLLTVDRVKERLEKIAGDKKRVVWIVEPMDERPKGTEYRQMLTKTHVVKGLPDVYGTLTGEVDSMYERFKPLIAETIDLELERHYKIAFEKDFHGTVYVDKEKHVAHRMFGRILNVLSTRLSGSVDYLRRSQIDEDVRIETFWCVGGFTGEGNTAAGKWSSFKASDGTNYGILLFQYRHSADWQIRTENPSPQFVERESTLSTDGNIPHFNYGPTASGLNYVMERPITVSGHWIGDPCEYCPLSLHVMPTVPSRKLLTLGDEFLQDARFSFGMTAAFGSCVAQAHNQGFTYLHELTYPFTTQCLVTDGRCIQLYNYQLNTLRLWMDPTGNALNNIVWSSDAIPLFEGDLRRPNDEAFKMLLRCLLLRPSARPGVDMRPNLPQEPAPLEQTAYINRKGEEAFPREKIGRFQYPKNAVYS